jgi:thymidylate kinase
MIPLPDLTILLSVDPAIAYERISKRGGRGHDETLDFLSFAHKEYDKLCNLESTIVKINGELPPVEVHNRIWATICSLKIIDKFQL